MVHQMKYFWIKIKLLIFKFLETSSHLKKSFWRFLIPILDMLSVNRVVQPIIIIPQLRLVHSPTYLPILLSRLVAFKVRVVRLWTLIKPFKVFKKYFFSIVCEFFFFLQTSFIALLVLNNFMVGLVDWLYIFHISLNTVVSDSLSFYAEQSTVCIVSRMGNAFLIPVNRQDIILLEYGVIPFYKWFLVNGIS